MADIDGLDLALGVCASSVNYAAGVNCVVGWVYTGSRDGRGLLVA